MTVFILSHTSITMMPSLGKMKPNSLPHHILAMTISAMHDKCLSYNSKGKASLSSGISVVQKEPNSVALNHASQLCRA